MRISFSPQRSDAALSVSKAGDALTINGTIFDFSVIPEGGVLPAEGVDCLFVVGDVRREAGDLMLTLILPHGVDPSAGVRFPDALIDPADGVLNLPADEETANG